MKHASNQPAETLLLPCHLAASLLRKQHKLTNARLYAWLHFWMHGKGAKTALMPLFDHEMAEETARLVIGSFHDGD
jgi:hypothetical protein